VLQRALWTRSGWPVRSAILLASAAVCAALPSMPDEVKRYAPMGILPALIAFPLGLASAAVWQRLQADVELQKDGQNAVFVLGTGLEEDNLRTALWLRRKYPLAMVIARSSRESRFASEVAAEHNFISISINQLVEENIPKGWVEMQDN
jgi:hypothetical protein